MGPWTFRSLECGPTPVPCRAKAAHPIGSCPAQPGPISPCSQNITDHMCHVDESSWKFGHGLSYRFVMRPPTVQQLRGRQSVGQSRQCLSSTGRSDAPTDRDPSSPLLAADLHYLVFKGRGMMHYKRDMTIAPGPLLIGLASPSEDAAHAAWARQEGGEGDQTRPPSRGKSCIRRGRHQSRSIRSPRGRVDTPSPLICQKRSLPNPSAVVRGCGDVLTWIQEAV